MILLNLINQSNDTNNSTIVIFQAPPAGDTAPGDSAGHALYAWKVISNIRPGETFTFKYPSENFASACDSWGNFGQMMPAPPGSSFVMQLTSDGEELTHINPPLDPGAVVIRNGMKSDAISAYIYKGGRPLAAKMNMKPGQEAWFVFPHEICVCVMPDVQEGLPFPEPPEATRIAIDPKIKRADIVMTGGGSGSAVTPFRFTLQNVVMV
ncbi:MAG: hypothetical protein FD123_2253 [Bacteroidetes bacterium]|nr:MAG: hypothetical protein FD123_2253 [Bacteroidota bacterium]